MPKLPRISTWATQRTTGGDGAGPDGARPSYKLGAFGAIGLDDALLKLVLDEHHLRRVPRLAQLWTYYRNPLRPVWNGLRAAGAGAGAIGPGRWYRQAQEGALPARIIGRAGMACGGGTELGADENGRREVVVENDIAWRVQAMVDFMFAKPVAMVSTAADEEKRGEIERFLEGAWERSGGIALLQDMALLGHVYGSVDLVVRVDGAGDEGRGDEGRGGASRIRVEVVEPTRGVAILDPADYRRMLAYVITLEREELAIEAGRQGAARRARSRYVEILGLAERGAHRQAYINERLVSDEGLAWTGGHGAAPGQARVPVVHIQNISEPFRYEGLSEVEPLIPLQDELNTRLSDRASRVTMQSFKMYLAKGLEGFERAPVGPGAVWSTDNPDAQVQEFGGDGDSPSEERHIQEVREAMDKASGVPPLASGVVRARIGNLTSANALRITMMGLLSKTARKRVTYGRGIAQACELMLAAANWLGVLKTSPAERGIRLNWPDPLPEDLREQVQAAEAKARLGVPAARLIEELGYGHEDRGVS